MLEIELWIVESWISNVDKIEYIFYLCKGVIFLDGILLDVVVVVKNFDIYGLGDKVYCLFVLEVINNYQCSEVIDLLMVKFYFNKLLLGFLQGIVIIGFGLVFFSILQCNFEELGDV